MGKEARELFIARDGYTLVGADASGLELRILAHFMSPYDDGAYGDIILNGDIHTVNQKAAGLPTRDMAKTFIYALLYGAGDAKIGSIIGGSAKEGKRLKAQFFKNTPAMVALTQDVQHQVLSNKRGGLGRRFLKGISGRQLYVRSPHSALNLILQSAGAYYMKYWLVELDRRLQKGNYDYYWVGNIHDEAQAEVRDDQVERFKTLEVQTFIDVGIMIGMRIKMEGEAKSGRSWAETH